LKSARYHFDRITEMIEAVDQVDELVTAWRGLEHHQGAIQELDSSWDEIEVSFWRGELRPYKEQATFLKKLQQILRDNEYPPKMLIFDKASTIIMEDNPIFMLSRKKTIDGLRNGKTIVEIHKELLTQKELVEESRKLKSLNEEEKKIYFSNLYFSTSTTPPWYEILRVTDCDCCNFRYFNIYSQKANIFLLNCFLNEFILSRHRDYIC
jgi:hypothetical protein